MLRLAGCMPGLTSAETSDMIHELLNDEIEYIHEMEKDRKKDRVFGVDAPVYEDYFPEYLRGTDTPEKKLRELSKILIADKEFTPDLEIEYAINKIIEDMKENDDHAIMIAETYYDRKGRSLPKDFFDELWECIFFDNDYTFLDEGHTLESLTGSTMDSMMGITGGVSAVPEEDGRRMIQ